MFVHFPIALLVTYSMLELVSIKFITRYPNWFFIKASFVIIGVLSAFPTLMTGDMLEELSESKRIYDHNLVELHSSFAGATTIFYGAIALIYLIALIANEEKVRNYITGLKFMPSGWSNIFERTCQGCQIMVKHKFLILLAFIGLILVTITGGLGGILSSGYGVDPFADFIYNLFF